MQQCPRRKQIRLPMAGGFALVLSLMILMLLGLVAIALLGISSIELRRTSEGQAMATARANARLAMMEALGRLQAELGPDQRVSAPATTRHESPSEPHWTGVWESTRPTGGDWLTRDIDDGGLRDGRWQAGGPGRDAGFRGWLVSGGGDAGIGDVENPVLLATSNLRSPARAGRQPILNSEGQLAGHHAWWVGDLGVRANLATDDPREGVRADVSSPGNGGLWRLMASQTAEVSFGNGESDPSLNAEIRRKLASEGTAALAVNGVFAEDFTVHSRGVIADTASGGLRKNLTAWLEAPGDIPAHGGSPGLAADDVIVGSTTGGSPVHSVAGPRFGVLRDWARASAVFGTPRYDARLPDHVDPDKGHIGAYKEDSRARALANEVPVLLAGNSASAVLPILVEASHFVTISAYQFRTETGALRFQVRSHLYPRIVLWNPYPLDLVVDRSIVMIQGNGRNEMWTNNVHLNANGNIVFRSRGEWLMFEGGRSTLFNARGLEIMNTEGYNDPYIGSYYYTIPRTRIGPGECLVFSPARSMEYNGLSAYNTASYDLSANELSSELPPDPARSFYISGTEISGGIPYQPVEYWYAPTPYWSAAGRRGVENQAEEMRAIWKHLGDYRGITYEDFDSLPQLAVISASLQYGAGREPRLAWNSEERMPVELLDFHNPRPSVPPNVRTREGVRLRWFDEHASNVLGAGPLARTAFFEEALLANWNPRASFIIRSPWENIGGTLPISGTSAGPWFFGAYTRDLFDQAVGWDEQQPVPRGGRMHGNPFGPPQEGSHPRILFDVPRRETGVLSLAQFQHVRLSELVWHPSFAIGNSLVDPRLGDGGMRGIARTTAATGDSASDRLGGFHPREIGWASDQQRAQSRNHWADNARAILGGIPSSDRLVYDLSYEANLALWDRFFLASADGRAVRTVLEDPAASPLPNARLRPAGSPAGTIGGDPADFHHAAANLMLEGAFNVNSTSVEAWKAMLASNREANGGTAAFPRILSSPGGEWFGGNPDAADAWLGHRSLDDEEIQRLAEAIVFEVRRRGPFLSLSDFVNRRLAEDESGVAGTLEAAIRRAAINQRHEAARPLDNTRPLPSYRHPDNIADATRIEQTLKPSAKNWGAPTFLTQADVLQVIGPALAARSDTFVIRAYGDATDASGRVIARAWCEAVVQRTPRPVTPDATGINPAAAVAGGVDFGRRFDVTAFRWLSPAEI